MILQPTAMLGQILSLAIVVLLFCARASAALACFDLAQLPMAYSLPALSLSMPFVTQAIDTFEVATSVSQGRVQPFPHS